MKNKGLIFSLALVLASCGANEHKPANGSVDSIIPLPQEMHVVDDEIGLFCDGKLVVAGEEVLGDSWTVISEWLENAGVKLEETEAIRPNLSFALNPEIEGAEAYKLVVAEDQIKISASTQQGLYWGWTTLRLMLPQSGEVGGLQSGFFLPKVDISDSPEFEHRGLLLDCCRHFMEPEFVKKMIDNLSIHKMNVLHWHLTEDQGWRVEIDAYPKLTEVGAWRTQLDGRTHGGFYTKETIREIVEYAALRHVEIVPEIEVPGHSQAALSSYPWLGCTGEELPVANKWGVFKDIYCPGNDSTLRFLEKVFDEVCELFPSDRIHIGGDEAPKVRWAACDKCQARIKSEGLANENELQTWIIEHVGNYLESKGKTIIGWDEILEGGLPEGSAVQSWRGMTGAIEGVHLGTDVISSPTSHCYLDYPLSSTDLEEIYSFNPEPEEASHGPGRVLGGECNMWSERAPQHLVESKVFPRAIGLAEVLWSGTETTLAEGAYSRFKKRLGGHLNRLGLLEVDYGFETVPVSISLSMDEDERKLYANVIASASCFTGEAEFVKSDGSSSGVQLFGNPLEIDGPGEVVTQINYMGRTIENPKTFFVDNHAAIFREITLDYEPSQYYTGGGNYALVDGRTGSINFRDGNWQAVQGEDMVFNVDFASETAIDSISMNFILYQDAWIFPPSKLSIYVDDALVSEIDYDEVFVKDDRETILNLSTGPLANITGQTVKVHAHNAGPCPDWHAAATEPTWIFIDELVVRELLGDEVVK